MHYDPYESKKSKRNRVISNILICFFIVAFIWGMYTIFIGTVNKVTLFEFKDKNAEFSVSGDVNAEFADLYDYSYNFKEGSKKDDEFDKRFPIASALLSMQKGIYQSDSPYMCIDSSRFVLAQTVLSETADCRELEIMMADFEKTEENNSLSVSMKNFNIYTIMYNARTGELSYKDYKTSQFHTNLYSLSVIAEAGRPTECSYELVMTGASFDKAKCAQLVYDTVNATYGDPEVKIKGKKATVTATQKDSALKDDTDKAVYSLKTADGTFAMIKEFKVKFTFEDGVKPSLKVIANNEDKKAVA